MKSKRKLGRKDSDASCPKAAPKKPTVKARPVAAKRQPAVKRPAPKQLPKRPPPKKKLASEEEEEENDEEEGADDEEDKEDEEDEDDDEDGEEEEAADSDEDEPDSSSRHEYKMEKALVDVGKAGGKGKKKTDKGSGKSAATVVELSEFAYGWIHSLSSSEGKKLNGQACKLMEFDEESGRWQVLLLPDCDEMHRIKPTSLTAVSDVKEVIQVFKKTYTIDGVAIHLRGTPQGDRVPMIIARFPDGKLLGGARVSAASVEDSFKVMKDILEEMADGRLPFSKTAFYTRRDELVSSSASAVEP